jgi:hypothetical protein
MHLPERQNEIDIGCKSDVFPSAQVESDAILHAGMFDAPLDLGEHGRLNISRNHPA